MRALACLTLVCAAAFSQGAGEQVQISVDKETLMSDFLDRMSAATKTPILYDPNGQRIRGVKLGSSFTQSVPKARLFDTFRAILSFYELSLVPVGPRGYEVYLVIDSRSTNNFVKNKAIYVEPKDLSKFEDQDGVYVACAVPVRHIENLTTLRTALSTMVSPAGIGRVHEVPGSQSILIMDFAPSVAAMVRLITRMDVPNEDAQRVYAVIELKHARAKDLADALNKTLQEEEPPPQPARTRSYASGPARVATLIVPYAPRNALLVRCGKPELEHVRELVKQLDLPEKRQVTAD